jgi:hypothetical protein
MPAPVQTPGPYRGTRREVHEHAIVDEEVYRVHDMNGTAEPVSFSTASNLA